MAITVIKSPDQFSWYKNLPAFTVSSDNLSAINLSVRVFIENEVTANSFDFVYKQRLYLDGEGQTEIQLSNLSSVLETDIPDLSITAPKAVAKHTRKYKIEVGEREITSEQIVSENFIISSNSTETVDLEEQLVNGDQYIIEIDGAYLPSVNPTLISATADTQNINNPVLLNDRVYYPPFTVTETGNRDWTKISIVPGRTYRVKKNPIIYTELDQKFIINGGKDV